MTFYFLDWWLLISLRSFSSITIFLFFNFFNIFIGGEMSCRIFYSIFLFLQIVIEKSDSCNEFAKFNELYVVIFWKIIGFIEHSHHAINIGRPDLFWVERLPVMVIVCTGFLFLKLNCILEFKGEHNRMLICKQAFLLVLVKLKYLL